MDMEQGNGKTGGGVCARTAHSRKPQEGRGGRLSIHFTGFGEEEKARLRKVAELMEMSIVTEGKIPENLDILVIGDAPSGKKVVDALAYGVTMISREEFIEMAKEGGTPVPSEALFPPKKTNAAHGRRTEDKLFHEMNTLIAAFTKKGDIFGNEFAELCKWLGVHKELDHNPKFQSAFEMTAVILEQGTITQGELEQLRMLHSRPPKKHFSKQQEAFIPQSDSVVPKTDKPGTAQVVQGCITLVILAMGAWCLISVIYTKWLQ